VCVCERERAWGVFLHSVGCLGGVCNADKVSVKQLQFCNGTSDSDTRYFILPCGPVTKQYGVWSGSPRYQNSSLTFQYRHTTPV